MLYFEEVDFYLSGSVGIYNIIVYIPGIFISIKNRVTSKSSMIIVRSYTVTVFVTDG